MIKTENGSTEVKAKTPQELFEDMLQIITTFIAYSKAISVPEEIIEKTLVQMIVDGFNDSKNGNMIDLREQRNDENSD